jgi:foldase protein PrsA
VSPQGKKGRPAAPARADRGRRHTLVALAVFAVFVVGSFIVAAVAQGIGGPSVPDDAVAVVEDAPDGTITTEDFDRALEQTAARQGLPEVPPSDDPQYEPLADAAVSDLILSRWVLGEAEDRGIEVTDREIDEELENVKEQQFGSEKEFQRFLDQSGFTLEEARERIALQLISDRIQMAVLPQEPEIDEDEIQTFYDENITQFEQPETRDVRVILTRDEADADDAAAALAEDSSPKGFEEVAREFSIDEATKSAGGLREAVVEGQSEPALEEQIFNAPEGELVGPFESEQGFYLIQVEAINAAETTPLADATEQITQTLASARQQQIAQAFQEDFQTKWVARTVCADDFRIDRCSNAEPLPSPCTEEVAETQGCDAPVASTRPIAPGTAGVFGAPAPTGLPQGPISPAPATPPGGLPPGLSPVPGAPPGTVPPGTAPPGTAPPGAAPPGTAPPGTAPPGTAPPGTAPPGTPPGG